MSAATSLRKYLLDHASVTDLIGERFYPDVLPQGAVKPAVVYRVIDRPREHDLAGPADLARTRTQIDCYAATRLAADAVANAIEAALAAFAAPDDMSGTWVMTVELDGPSWLGGPPADGSDEWDRISTLDVILHHSV